VSKRQWLPIVMEVRVQWKTCAWEYKFLVVIWYCWWSPSKCCNTLCLVRKTTIERMVNSARKTVFETCCKGRRQYTNYTVLGDLHLTNCLLLKWTLWRVYTMVAMWFWLVFIIVSTSMYWMTISSTKVRFISSGSDMVGSTGCHPSNQENPNFS
jgi:thiosulfate reductase cytochrome b subunit